MTNLLPIKLSDETKAQLDLVSRMVGKPKEAVAQELVEQGLQQYQTSSSKSFQAVLDLITWAERENITSPMKDLSIHHNKYAWEE